MHACIVLGAMLLGSVHAIWRMIETGSAVLIPNADRLHNAFEVPTTLYHLFTFNPLQLLLHPFALSAYADSRTEFFLESVVKSSQFGFFWFGHDAAIVLLLFLYLLPITVIGWFRMLRYDRFPLHATILVLCAGLLYLRLSYPYAPSQNFRYVALLALPFACVLAHGARSIRLFPVRALAEIVILSYVSVTVAFFLSLALVS